MSVSLENGILRSLNRLGFRKLAWSLRRLHVPAPAVALVLEVGSGGNPYARANVLVDAYEETRERHWDPLVHDRPTVLAKGERLPFKDKAFDFVLAVHVLEHTPDPATFLSELQRVAKAGYIETPDAFMERVNPYKDHRLEVTVRDDKLVIRKKPGWVVDGELVELYENAAKPAFTRRHIPSHPADYHVRFYWRDEIKFEVLNPDVAADWQALESAPPPPPTGLAKLKAQLRRVMLGATRQLFSQNGRNAKLDIATLLRCPVCGSASHERRNDKMVCTSCGASHDFRGDVLIIEDAGR